MKNQGQDLIKPNALLQGSMKRAVSTLANLHYTSMKQFIMQLSLCSYDMSYILTLIYSYVMILTYKVHLQLKVVGYSLILTLTQLLITTLTQLKRLLKDYEKDPITQVISNIATALFTRPLLYAVTQGWPKHSSGACMIQAFR